MKQIADASGGTTSDAPTAEALQAVYEKLGSAVAEEPGTDQLTAVPVGVALVLLVVGAGLALRLTGRIV
jgi:Ca-activated chloride channel family protein